MTLCPSTGLLSAAPWTESEPPPTESISDTSSDSERGRGELSLVPDPDDGFTSALFVESGRSPDTAPITAPIVEPGSPLVGIPGDDTFVGLCIVCARPRRNPHKRSLCEVCYCHKLAFTLCQRCGGEKSGEGRARGKLCAKCREAPYKVPSRRLACRVCQGDKEPGRTSPYCVKCAEERIPRCMRCHKRPKRPEKGARLCAICKRYERKRQDRYRRDYVKRKRLRLMVELHGVLNQLLVARQEWRVELEVVPTDHKRQKQAVDACSFPKLPAEPLGQKIKRLISAERGAIYTYVPCFKNAKGEPMVDHVRKGICYRLQVSERAFGNWCKEGSMVEFDIADDVLGHAGWNWIDVWDGDEITSNGQTVEEVFESTELTIPVAA